jgi:flagellar biogenesis protein FliO
MELSPYAKTLLVLLPVLASILLIYAGLRYILKRMGALPSRAPEEEETKLRIVSRQYLPPQQYVTLLEYGDRRYLIYSADRQMLLLDRFPGDE